MTNEILILAEHLKGVLGDVTLELIGLGRRIADEQKIPLSVALIGQGAKDLAASIPSANTVIVVQDGLPAAPTPDAITDVLAGLVEMRHPSLVLIGGTNLSVGVGAKVARRTNLPFINFCKELRVSGEGRTVVSQIFGGKMNAEIALPSDHGIIGVCPGCFPADAAAGGPTPVVEEVSVPAKDRGITFTKFLEPDLGGTDITKESVLVGVGRGIENESNMELAEDLAKALGGAVCGSRPVIDQGWLPLNRQVGKSGMIVKPKVYFSLGISGAPEHVEGMKNSALVISINKDPAAPIFDVSHVGACADLLDILPPLIEKVKARKGG
jgi:electron transfer flavoprotein alpha subunit